MTSSPLFTPMASSASSSAVVPELTATPPRTPTKAAILRWNASTRAPPATHPHPTPPPPLPFPPAPVGGGDGGGGADDIHDGESFDVRLRDLRLVRLQRAYFSRQDGIDVHEHPRGGILGRRPFIEQEDRKRGG